MGTVRYMSPEQVLGKELDARTDLFSLGVVLYEMTTGRLPFSGSNASEVTDRILHAQPEAIARFNYDVPAELERIIRKCLEKDRERRYQSARELLVDLRNLKRESDSRVVSAEKMTQPQSRFASTGSCRRCSDNTGTGSSCALSADRKQRSNRFIGSFALRQCEW